MWDVCCMILKKVKERIPSTDIFHRPLCGDDEKCRTVRCPDDRRLKIVKEGNKIKICAYDLVEITEHIQQIEKLTPAGGIEFGQNAGLMFKPSGCHEFSEDELSDDIFENPRKVCDIYNRRKKTNSAVRSC